MNAQLQQATVKQSKPFMPAPVLQRKCACGQHTVAGGECAECRKKRLSLQRRPADQATSSSVPPIVHEVLRSPGQPLEPAIRAYMEPRFGHDFSRVQLRAIAHQQLEADLTANQLGDPREQEADRVAERVIRTPMLPASSNGTRIDFSQVRVHADAKAAESARAMNALAYTAGRDVVFGARQYAPNTADGRILLAHELTHVIQQNRAHAVHGSDSGFQPLQRPYMPTIQFQRFRDCTPAITGTTGTLTQARIDTMIHYARQQARAWVTHALNEIRGIRAGAGTSTGRAALTRHFGAPTPAAIGTIFSRYTNIQGRLPNDALFICNTAGSFYCGPPRNWCSYNDCPGLSHLTHLCPPFFQNPRTCLEPNRSRLILHEAAHAAGACNDVFAGGGYPPANAHDNAPSYVGFAVDVMPRPTLRPSAPDRPRSPSLIEGVIRGHERRMKERILETAP